MGLRRAEPAGSASATSTTASRWVSIILLGCCLAGLALMSVRSDGTPPSRPGTIYDAARFTVLAALAAAGVGLLLARSAPAVRAWSAAGAVLAGQLVGTGVVATKQWRPYSGMTGLAAENLGVLRACAAALAVVAAVALAACVISLRASGAVTRPGDHRLRAGRAWGSLVPVGVPVLLGFGSAETFDVTSLGAYGLLFALPWGMSLAATDRLTDTAARAAAAAVGLSAVVSLLALTWQTKIQISNPYAGPLLAAVAAGAVATARRRKPE